MSGEIVNVTLLKLYVLKATNWLQVKTKKNQDYFPCAFLHIFISFFSDCRGKMCYNGGTLDLNTCTCSCADMYSGDSCQIREIIHQDCFIASGKRSWGKVMFLILYLSHSVHGGCHDVTSCYGSPRSTSRRYAFYWILSCCLIPKDHSSFSLIQPYFVKKLYT